MEEFASILGRGVRAVYQPVVDIERDEVVGYEALVRADAPLSRPADLFAAAAEAGMTAELDWACRRAAFTGALAAGLRPPATLFFNADPSTLGVEVPRDLQLLSRRAQADLRVVVEVPERHLLAAPAEMLDKLEHARDQGWGIALDDVGRDWASLALLTLVRPDVVKLDTHLIQEPLTPATTQIARALQSYARESGAQLLAEGVETGDHLARARALGVRLAQGCHFGWPTGLPGDASRRRCGTVRVPRPAPIRDETPAEIADLIGLRWRMAPADELAKVSIGLEDEAAASRTPAVVLSCFDAGQHFTPGTARRYARLAEVAAFVSVFGPGMPAAPAPNVKGTAVPAGHRLAGEWTVVVITPAFAGALIARRNDELATAFSPASYDYTITDDRATVIRIARALARSMRAPDSAANLLDERLTARRTRRFAPSRVSV